MLEGLSMIIYFIVLGNKDRSIRTHFCRCGPGADGWRIYLRVSLSFNPGQLEAVYCMTRVWRHSVPFFLE